MPRTNPIRRFAVPLLLGAGLGLFSSRADMLPADTLLHVVVAMGNAIGPWVGVAFLAGAIQRDRRSGAAAGALALSTGVAAYYVAGLLTWGQGVPEFLPTLFVAWLVVAVITGVVLGGAGGEWAGDGRFRSVGPMILAGTMLAEAAYRFIEVEGWLGIELARTGVQIAVIEAMAALLLPAILLERSRWPIVYFGSVGIGAVGLVLIGAVASLIRFALFG